MKKLILAVALIGLTGSVLAQVTVSREALGSGQPGSNGFENATQWDNNIFHAPQYMPGYPTAAMLYPRVVDLECVKVTNGLNCKGYNWSPELGRGEYLMIHPVVKQEPTPVINNTTVRQVLVEVPAKKKGE